MRHKDFAMGTFDEVMASNVCHDLRARENFCVQLGLDLLTLLDTVNPSKLDIWD